MYVLSTFNRGFYCQSIEILTFSLALALFQKIEVPRYVSLTKVNIPPRTETYC